MGSQPSQDRTASPPGQDGVVELLGLLAYAELTACLRTAVDADRCPHLGVQVALARVATVEFGHYELLAARLAALGEDPETRMEPFRAAIGAFHDRTMPRDWLEGLVKAYVGDGIARDFYREVATRLEGEARALVDGVLANGGQDDLLVRTIKEAIATDPAQAGRLALWGRRLVGEAIAQAQYVAAERDALASLIVGGGDRGSGWDLAELGRMVARLTEAHATRMDRLGLRA